MGSVDRPIAVFGGDWVLELDEFSITHSDGSISVCLEMSDIMFESPNEYDTLSLHHDDVMYLLSNYSIDLINWTMNDSDDVSETEVDIFATDIEIHETV